MADFLFSGVVECWSSWILGPPGFWAVCSGRSCLFSLHPLSHPLMAQRCSPLLCRANGEVVWGSGPHFHRPPQQMAGARLVWRGPRTNLSGRRQRDNDRVCPKRASTLNFPTPTHSRLRPKSAIEKSSNCPSIHPYSVEGRAVSFSLLFLFPIFVFSPTFCYLTSFTQRNPRHQPQQP